MPSRAAAKESTSEVFRSHHKEAFFECLNRTLRLVQSLYFARFLLQAGSGIQAECSVPLIKSK